MTPHVRPQPARTAATLDDLLIISMLAAVALLGAVGLLLWSAGQACRAADPRPLARCRARRRPAHRLPAAAPSRRPGGGLATGCPRRHPRTAAALRNAHRADGRSARLGGPGWVAVGSAPRRAVPPGAGPSSAWAKPGQVPELLVRDATPGRVLLGRLGPTWCGRRRLVAAEPRRSVLVVAPTQAGKTSRIVIPTVLRWTGPMLVTSVKPDVLRLTLTERLRRGPAYVFDPTGSLTRDAGGGGAGAATETAEPVRPPSTRPSGAPW